MFKRILVVFLREEDLQSEVNCQVIDNKSFKWRESSTLSENILNEIVYYM